MANGKSCKGGKGKGGKKGY